MLIISKFSHRLGIFTIRSRLRQTNCPFLLDWLLCRSDRVAAMDQMRCSVEDNLDIGLVGYCLELQDLVVVFFYLCLQLFSQLGKLYH
jgi:hypothetical protein